MVWPPPTRHGTTMPGQAWTPDYGRGTTPITAPRAILTTTPILALRPSKWRPFTRCASCRAAWHLRRIEDRRACPRARQPGAPIGGLYAAGNDMNSIMGGHYPGGGITLGPAMTFGWIAARHIAAQTSEQPEDAHANAPMSQLTPAPRPKRSTCSSLAEAPAG
jgi:hypothetical protein